MGIAAATKVAKNLVKRLLRDKYTDKFLYLARKTIDRYHNWLFQTPLVYVDRKKYLKRRLKGWAMSAITQDLVIRVGLRMLIMAVVINL